jgi:hypothetical protein
MIIGDSQVTLELAARLQQQGLLDAIEVALSHA